jgi:hypothetical protein
MSPYHILDITDIGYNTEPTASMSIVLHLLKPKIINPVVYKKSESGISVKALQIRSILSKGPEHFAGVDQSQKSQQIQNSLVYKLITT